LTPVNEREDKTYFGEVHFEWTGTPASGTGTLAMSRILTVFYSRTGHTHSIAEVISGTLGADLEELEERRRRNYLIAGLGALFKRETQLKPVRNTPENYDLVIVGTPVWASSLPPAVRTYIHEHAEGFERIAFFCTEGNIGGQDVFKQMEDLCGKSPVATLEITEDDIKSGKHKEKTASFVEALKPALAPKGTAPKN
jgi:flavodoxin